MGKSHLPRPVKLLCGMISGENDLLVLLCRKLSRKFGPLDLKSPIMRFNYTDYYNEEMGESLLRQFVAFSKLIRPERLSDIKLFTNRLEHEFAAGPHKDRRRINLDPGYISEAKLILATTKDYSHRIYLKRGIYAEVTLYFSKGTFRPYHRTYPDYATKEYISFFNAVRISYLDRLGLKR